MERISRQKKNKIKEKKKKFSDIGSRRYFFSQKKKEKKRKKINVSPDHDPRDYHSLLHSFPKEKKKKKEKKKTPGFNPGKK